MWARLRLGSPSAVRVTHPTRPGIPSVVLVFNFDNPYTISL